MPRRARSHFVIALVILAAATTLRADDGPVAARRQQLERERAAVEARYRQEHAACADRFTVTACTDDAKTRRRQALEPLERERAALDEQERRRRAAERLQRIEDKRQEAARRQPPALQTPRPPLSAPLPDAAPRAGRPAQPRAAPPPPGPRPGSAQAYERRQQEAEAHRAAVKRRNDSRQRPPAAPMPAPSAPP
jgi:colicin import membrane protein